MISKRRRAEIAGARLAALYPSPPIPLDHRDPFTLLVAVALSAQCTDKAVNKATPALFALADTPEKMAALPAEVVLEKIRFLGLAPGKSRNLVAMSRLLVERHGGLVPEDFTALEALPGVGHKTASVVMSQAFGRPAFPVDTHIHRLATRWRLTDGSSVTRTEHDLKRLFPESEWRDLHLRIIYYGREHCSARGCDGRTCPICAELAEADRAENRRTRAGDSRVRGV